MKTCALMRCALLCLGLLLGLETATTVTYGRSPDDATATSTAAPAGPANLIKTTPVFSDLALSPAITYGTTNLMLSGTLSAPGPIYPALGEVITVTINGKPQSTTITNATGNFSLPYKLSTLTADQGPYNLTYFYPGSVALNAAADTSTFLTVNPALLTVTANNVTRGYGQPNPAFTDTLVGVVNGDVFTITNTCSATTNSLPGQYPIVPALLDPANRLANYSTTLNNGTLTVSCPTITLSPTNATLPQGLVDAVYSQTLTATGAFGGHLFAITSGDLPAGLSFSDEGVLSGTPTGAGTNVFTVTATDTNGCSGSQTYTLVTGIVPSIAAQPDSQTNYVGGTTLFTVTAEGSQPLYYQWHFNETNLTDNARVSGSQSNRLSLSNLRLSDAGSFTVVVANAFGSVTSSVAVLSVYVPFAPLTVQVQGPGVVVPDLNGQHLAVGQTYTLTAVPDVGFVLTNWTGSLTASTPVLRFTMQSNLVLQANFVRGEFFSLKGTYNGLFYETNRPAPVSSGTFTLSTTASRSFSGSLLLAGTRYPLRGVFDTNGTAEVFVPARKANALRVALRMDLTPGSDRLTGTVSDGTWTAVLAGDRAVFDGKQHLAPQAGAYTMVIPGSDHEPFEPCGNGYGTISVSKAGRVQLAATLADGTKISQGAMVSKDGQWPLFVSLYGRRGLLLGWLTFTNDSTMSLNLGGDLNWLKPAGPGKYYSAGFLAETSALGSRWVAPANGTGVLALTNATLMLSGGNLGQVLTKAFKLGVEPKAYAVNGKDQWLNFSLSSGAFSGRILEPVSGKRLPFGGVVLQGLNSGYGCFLGSSQSGEVYLGR